MRARKRKRVYKKKKKISDKMFWWKVLCIVNIALMVSRFYSAGMREFGKSPGVKKWAVLVFCDGLRYRVDRYWNIKL